MSVYVAADAAAAMSTAAPGCGVCVKYAALGGGAYGSAGTVNNKARRDKLLEDEATSGPQGSRTSVGIPEAWHILQTTPSQYHPTSWRLIAFIVAD